MREGNDPSGSCRDSCWVDTSGNAHHTDEQRDPDAALTSDKLCHDGGPGAASNKCGYGTQVRLHN